MADGIYHCNSIGLDNEYIFSKTTNVYNLIIASDTALLVK